MFPIQYSKMTNFPPGRSWMPHTGLHGWSRVFQALQASAKDQDSDLQPECCHQYEEQEALPNYQDWRS